MLTEEKLQNFLNDLRLGKYDTEDYVIDPIRMSIADKNESEVIFSLYIETYDYVERKFLPNKSIKLKTPRYFIHVYGDDYILDLGMVQVQFNLYASFQSYFTELEEKDKLVRKLNIKKSFGL